MTTQGHSSKSNKKSTLLVLGFALIQSTLLLISACSVAPPCDVKATQIHLTNVTGVVHVDVNKYEECPIDWENPNHNFEAIDSTTIEVEVTTQTVHNSNSSFVARPLGEGVSLGLDLPTVDQLGIANDLNFMPNSEIVSIVFEGMKLEYTLTGFNAPASQGMYEGVIVFRSAARNLVYFIYPSTNADLAPEYKLASCQLEAPNNCEINSSVAKYDFFDIDKSALDRIQVWEESNMNLVALPLVCCLCVEARYFTFQESELTKQVEVLGNTINPIAVDSRIGMAYAVSGGNGQGIQIVAEPLVDGDGPQQGGDGMPPVKSVLQLASSDVFVDELQQPSPSSPTTIDVSDVPSVAPEVAAPTPVETDSPNDNSGGNGDVVPTVDDDESSEKTNTTGGSVGAGMSWMEAAMIIIPFLFLL